MDEKTGLTFDTRDFDVKFERVTSKQIPSAAGRAGFRVAALVIRDAIVEVPQVPKSRGVTKGGRRGQGPGHLRRSQKIENPRVEHGEISVECGFNTDYAAAVHEMPMETTQWSTPGTGSKYLESKLIRNKEKYAARWAEEIKREGGG